MNAFPSSVEASLLEAGFSTTEILILKRLLEGESLGLREIAIKTGKSTGVLDQALRKLLRKQIVHQETVNDTAKYAIQSLQAVVKWMENYTREQRDLLLRKHQNFETFITSLELDKNRPDFQYFDGFEGIKQAYRKLLDYGNEMLHYVPVLSATESVEMRDFRVEYFRERRRKGVFSRVIAHNTPLGRRYQTRDPFEYRQTLLVPEEHFPFTFEKIIAGKVVACFSHSEMKACFIRYADLAASERGMFEMIWHTNGKPLEGAIPPQPIPEDVRKEREVPASTKTLSILREFFLSRTSLIIMGIFACLSGLIIFGLYEYTFNLAKESAREKVVAIAATAALQFSVGELDQLHRLQDISKPEYKTVVNKLENIRNQNEGIKFVYILRPTSNKNIFEFIADADSIDPFAKKDLNNDGYIDSSDELNFPGEAYEVSAGAILALSVPSADKDAYSDKWGVWISGYAPIKDRDGKTIAIIGVDKNAYDIFRISVNLTVYLVTFAGLLAIFIAMRAYTFNKQIPNNMKEKFRT